MQKKMRTVASIKSFMEEIHLENQSTEMHSNAKKGDPTDIGALANQGQNEEENDTRQQSGQITCVRWKNTHLHRQ